MISLNWRVIPAKFGFLFLERKTAHVYAIENAKPVSARLNYWYSRSGDAGIWPHFTAQSLS
jgi:hypothetical protein